MESSIQSNLKGVKATLSALIQNERERIMEPDIRPISDFLIETETALQPIKRTVAKAHQLRMEIGEAQAELKGELELLKQHHFALSVLKKSRAEDKPWAMLVMQSPKKPGEVEAEVYFYRDKEFKKLNADRAEAGLEPLPDQYLITTAIQEHEAKKSEALKKVAALSNVIDEKKRALSELEATENNKIPFSRWENLVKIKEGKLKAHRDALNTMMLIARGRAPGAAAPTTAGKTAMTVRERAFFNSHPEQQNFQAYLKRNPPAIIKLLGTKENKIADVVYAPRLSEDERKLLEKELKSEEAKIVPLPTPKNK